MAEAERHRADGVFEGGGVKGIAFAGAIAAAERDAGVHEWVNVAGTSAGAIVACLLSVGYDSTGLHDILGAAEYRRFADYGFGGKLIGGPLNALRSRGLCPGRYFMDWLSDQLAKSPLAKELGKDELTFADVRRRDLPPREELPDVSDEQYERAKYRLHVIASDVTSGRMIVLPDQIEQYEDERGKAFVKDEFPLVRAVRMSMSYPFLFQPIELYKDRRRYFVVDGGLLSNFPIWLFDGPHPKRPTWGFRLHGGASPTESLPYRKVPRPLWEVPLIKAMFFSAMEAWDRTQLSRVTSSRTVSIPTHGVKTTNFALTKDEANDLYGWGEQAAATFFNDPAQQAYLNTFGETVGHTAVPAAAPA